MNPEFSRKQRKQIGAFFTPLPLACEMIRAYGIHKRWAGGDSVLDPSAGNGALLEAMILCCQEDGIELNDAMLRRLKGCEREEVFTREFVKRIEERYGITPPEDCLICQDFLRRPEDEFDLILGNPPWLNFTDLPEEEKESFKSEFIRYGLTGGGKEILLGNARIDLAALFIRKAVQSHLKDEGRGYFFIPLSLLFNEGAHNRFRQGDLGRGRFHFKEIRDFGSVQVFPDVSTRSGFTVIVKTASPDASSVPDSAGTACSALSNAPDANIYGSASGSASFTSVPADTADTTADTIPTDTADSAEANEIPYHLLNENGTWLRKSASPVSGPGSAFAVQDGTSPPPKIKLPESARPRQGINTGGRNSLFIFNKREKAGAGLVKLSNRERVVTLPESLVYPLISAAQFKGKKESQRFIFLPYSADGKVMTREELEDFPEAWSYLESCRESLLQRKGSMLQSTMKKGWWALLGIGPYSFSPWKIVWEAYGKREFTPALFGLFEGKPWIPNQALQASCSFTDRKTALTVLEELRHPDINRHLKLQNMEGTCNWAQPGRIRRFMEFYEEKDQ